MAGKEGTSTSGRSQTPQTAQTKKRRGKTSESELSARSETHRADAALPTWTIFLDRDGVLDKDRWPGLLTAKQWNWLPGARDALARLNRPDVRICLATNQPWTHTGVLTRRRLDRIHARMLEEARQAGGRVDRIEAATWPFGRRRKPRPGMLEDGAIALLRTGWTFDKARAVMVGDKPRDMEAARRFGIPGIRVGPHGDVPDLAAAVERILAAIEGKSPLAHAQA